MRLALDGARPQVEFKSIESFENWLSAERARWEWLLAATPEVNIGNAPALVAQSFNEVTSLIAQAKGQPEPLSWLEGHAQQRWQANGYLRFSEGENGAGVLWVREALGDGAAAFAYAFLLRQVNLSSTTDLNHIRAVLALAVPGMSDPVELGRRLALERTNFKSAQRSSISRIERAHAEQELRADALVKRGLRVARRLVRARHDDWLAATAAWKGDADRAVVEINDVKRLFEESMKLQGPVKYWSGKAREHGKNEWWAAQQVAFFFIVAGGLLAAAFAMAGAHMLEISQAAAEAKRPEPTAIYIIVGGGLAALSTLTFWIGRLLTKLWMSEHHLRNDAHERAVMTTTYLALTRNEKAEQIDRQIILNALFRNTPDGIVREDGADFGVQALMAKWLAKP